MRTRTESKNKNGISVLVAEDHGIMREALCCLLASERDLSVAGAVGDGSQAVKEVERLEPQVAVLGASLSGLNGMEAARVVVERFPRVAVIILASHAAPPNVRRALEGGVLGYLSRECAPGELAKAVRSVAAGKRYLGEGLSDKAIEPRGGRAAAEPIESLTVTERNILKLVAEGRSNAEVAVALGLSPRTIETYRLRLMRKLGLEDLASLVKYAIRHGIVPLE
jgi:DNA-binding NarL/FixJ family response regulator